MFTEVKGNKAMGFLSTKPLMIITTRHASGIVNAGVFGAYTNLSSSHLGIAIATRHHTYTNILRDREFTVNVPGADLVKTIKVLADEIPESRSEIEEAGLTLKDPLFTKTPSISECAAAVEFRYDKKVEIGHHDFIIGEAVGGWIRTELMDPDGKINIFKAKVFKDFKYPQPIYALFGETVDG